MELTCANHADNRRVLTPAQKAMLAKALAALEGLPLTELSKVEDAVRSHSLYESWGYYGPRPVAWAPVVRAEWNLHRQPPFGLGM